MGNLSPEIIVHFIERLAKRDIVSDPIVQEQSNPVSESVAIVLW
jgi:hypothetical protein